MPSTKLVRTCLVVLTADELAAVLYRFLVPHDVVHALEARVKSDEPESKKMEKVCAGVPTET